MTGAIRWPTLAWFQRRRQALHPSPVSRPRIRRLAPVLLSAVALAIFAWTLRPNPSVPREPVGLFSSMPILWGEADGLSNLLSNDRAAHRIKLALSARGPIMPLDTLEALPSELRQLVIVQPRPLSPVENFKLDGWVRGGGRLLLLADPMLTEPSIYALGDQRRPQDIVLLSPILAQWGLELTFDELQPSGLQRHSIGGVTVPVSLAGAWQTRNANCRIDGAGVLVTCQIGKGRVVALADAEVAAAQDPEGLREPALASMLDRAFGRH